MRICAYVQQRYAKSAYKNECMDTRQFVGLRIVIDCLERAGYNVEYAGQATVHQYDVVLVSLTSDCDWWQYISERMKWRSGNYKVLIGGAGVLHIAPFTRWFYAAMFGRGENLIVPLVQFIERGDRYYHESICYSDEFNADGKLYKIAQAEHPYEHPITLSKNRDFTEGAIGCNHKCLFCGYTWQRKFISNRAFYQMQDSLFGNIADKELAILDMGKHDVDMNKLRTTAIDGVSERIRFSVNKKISKQCLIDFLIRFRTEEKPHKLKIYNICGYPTETDDDYLEFVETIKMADQDEKSNEKMWGIDLHCTPFRAMPATPMACCAMSKNDYRQKLRKLLNCEPGSGVFYRGRNFWAVEGGFCDSLPTVMLSAIAHRGSNSDSENIARLCATKKFWSANGQSKQSTLERYFDMDKLFGAFTMETLPSRYLRTYCKIEKMWEV